MDTKYMYHLLTTRYGYDPRNIVMLNEKSSNRDFWPTKRNILTAANWLVSNVQYGDSLVFMFSGHGGQKRDRSGREFDGKCETILPLDHRQAGQIVDTELFNYLVRPLPSGSRLHMICDSCHSGTILDLNYMHTPPKHWNGPRAGRWEQINNFGIAGEAFLISGCRDDQCSVTTRKLSGGETTTGAMLYSFVQAVETNRANTYAELLFTMRSIIDGSLSRNHFHYNTHLDDDHIDYHSTHYNGTLATAAAIGLAAAVAGAIGGVGLAKASRATGGQRRFRRPAGFLGGSKTQIPQLSSAHMFDLNQRFSL